MIELLKDLGKEILKRKDELTRAFAEDIGVSVKIGNAEIDMTVDYLCTMEEELPWVEKRKPYGTVGAILPYDAPTIMFARLVGSALIGGNRSVVSFSSLTPTVKNLMMEITKDIPYIEINGKLDNRTFGEYCCKREDVRVFFVSGGDAVGKLFEERITFFDKIIFAGPSGMPPCLVLPDGDIKRAAEFTARRAFLNGGQYCTTIKRVYVPEKKLEEFLDLLLAKVDSIRVGDPLDPETDYGPIKAKRTRIIFERAIGKVEGEMLRGGTIDGEWIPPTVVLARNIPDMEMFGPFLAVKPYKNREDAVKEVCYTRFGHIAYIFGHATQSERKRLEETFGMIHFNPNFTFLPLRGPYGGKKDAGWVLERKKNKLIKRDGAIIYSREMTQ